MKEITIIIPFYNREAFLEKTLQSLANCQWRPLRLILVDNGSTDGSRQLCEKFAKTYHSSHFQIVVTEEPKRGAAVARNKGLALCETEFVYFFDSDDAFDPTFLPTVIPLLTDDIDLLAVTTRQVVGEKTQVRAYRKTASPKAQVLLSHLNTVAMVLRTDFLRKVGGWNETLTTWDDWELGLRVLLAKPRMRWFTKQPFHETYVHAESQTGDGFSSRIDAVRRAMEVAVKEAPRYSSALYYRMEILTGELLKEKNLTEANTNKKLICEWFAGKSVWTKTIGRLLRFYVSKGGRGAWRLAYLFC